jgi:uncharacterized cupin superfamily protein
MRLRRKRERERWPAPVPENAPEARKRYSVRVRPITGEREGMPVIIAWEAEVGRWNYQWHIGRSEWEHIKTFNGDWRGEVVADAEQYREALEAIPDEEQV